MQAADTPSWRYILHNRKYMNKSLLILSLYICFLLAGCMKDPMDSTTSQTNDELEVYLTQDLTKAEGHLFLNFLTLESQSCVDAQLLTNHGFKNDTVHINVLGIDNYSNCSKTLRRLHQAIPIDLSKKRVVPFIIQLKQAISFKGTIEYDEDKYRIFIENNQHKGIFQKKNALSRIDSNFLWIGFNPSNLVDSFALVELQSIIQPYRSKKNLTDGEFGYFQINQSDITVFDKTLQKYPIGYVYPLRQPITKEWNPLIIDLVAFFKAKEVNQFTIQSGKGVKI